MLLLVVVAVDTERQERRHVRAVSTVSRNIFRMLVSKTPHVAFNESAVDGARGMSDFLSQSFEDVV